MIQAKKKKTNSKVAPKKVTKKVPKKKVTKKVASKTGTKAKPIVKKTTATKKVTRKKTSTVKKKVPTKKVTPKAVKKTTTKKVVAKVVSEIKTESLNGAVSLPTHQTKKRGGRKKNPKNMYFTQDTEDAIVEFNECESKAQRERIYRERIYKPLLKLAENIYNTFKFSYFDTEPIDVQTDVVSFLTFNLGKYKSQANGGSKAFSYFSIVAKNWLILHNNNTYKRWKQHTEILDAPEEDTYGEILTAKDDREDDETREFLVLMVDYWERNLTRVFTKKRELDIAGAVVELFRISDRLEMFNKKALYLYIREISDCKTQHITKVINKMKSYQSEIRNEYLNSGNITSNVMVGEPSEFIDEC